MAGEEASSLPLWRRIKEWPFSPGDDRISAELAGLATRSAADGEAARLGELLAQPGVHALVTGVSGCSPYLGHLVLRDFARLVRILASSPERHFESLKEGLDGALAAASSVPDAMRVLRGFKSEVALLAALADLGGVWQVMTVTRVLAEAADAALQGSIRFLFRQATAKGDWIASDPLRPDSDSGYFVLGMGKHGAYELNYSSDIDLIVFYDREKARLRPGLEASAFFVRLTRDLVKLMQERTADGYVFRTDLRLRPDPGATQLALSTDSAHHYYESFGQNWERAAMIKARPVAGDLDAGARFLGELSPFVWRKYLDYAAIADIHAMKRQIHAFRGLGGIGVAGHDVKLGRGGIREIEFFVQTQQLIAGGRQADLRVRSTLEAIRRLEARGWIKRYVADELERAYLFLRRVEHRIQMIADEQTHSLPEDDAGLERIARFSGFATIRDFSRALVAELETVQRHYAALFEDVPELTRGSVNMVFVGEDDDPGTVEALSQMGYTQPSQVIASVRNWHRGRYAAVRSAGSRERLTEVQHVLIAALADTADPDLAFAGFDRFLAELPTGFQLFALLRANPALLRLVADIMGTAPRLARILSRRRRLLDAVIDPRTFTTLPSAEDLDQVIAADLASAKDVQEVLDRARVVGSEQAFLIGIRVLSGLINASQAGGAYALLADRVISALEHFVEAELIKAHGTIPGGGAAVIAMGKLGGREMTAASDLDLIVVYDFDPSATQSLGERPLAPSHFYARLTQRLITALTSPTAEGKLYEVDMRLRPSGLQGPVATQLTSFIHYQMNEAWTWEHMALTRARVVSAPEELKAKVEAAIRSALVQQRDRGKIAADVLEMRELIAKEKGTTNIWELKQVRGGLVDLEFMAQYLQLIHAARHPEILDQNTLAAFQKLQRAGLLADEHAEVVLRAGRLIHDLTQILRLCFEGPFDPAAAPSGLRQLLARAGDEPSFERLEARLGETLAEVHQLFPVIVR